MKDTIKAIVCDLDGTLLTKNKEILNETKRTLIQAQQQGIKVILASSRGYFMVEDVAAQLELEKYGGYIICYNGLSTINVKTKEEKSRHSIEDHITQKLLNYGKANRLMLVFESAYGIQIYVPFKLKWAMPLFYYNSIKKRYKDMRNMTFKLFGDFRFSPEQKLEVISKRNEVFVPIKKAGYIRLRKGMPMTLDVFREHFKGELDFIQISSVWADIMPKGVNKSTGLEMLFEELGFGFESIMAFGDADNDFEMIQKARLGIAMGNAMESIKAVADDITQSNNDNGIANAIKKYNLL